MLNFKPNIHEKFVYKDILGFPLTYFVFLPRATANNAVKYISNLNGLTNNSINCILEDEGHTIWIGTWDGLNAYNGRDITTFRYSKNDPNSISNNIIRQIIEHGDRLWIATDNGINAIHKETYEIKRYHLQQKGNIPNQEKSFVLSMNAEGKLICLVKGIGFFVYQQNQDKFIPITTNFANKVKDYIITESNELVFLFNDGSIKKERLSVFTDNYDQNSLKNIPTESNITQLFQTGGHTILNDRKNLFIYDNQMSNARKIQLNISKNISQVILIQNSMYISFIEGGCINYDLITNTYQYLKEISNQISIFTIYSGSQNILWIGTDGQGLIQLYHHNSPFKTIYTTHPVRCFCEDSEGNILVGTKGSGLKTLNRHTKQMSDFLNKSNGLASNTVYALKKNQSNDIFIGTEEEGIYILKDKTKKIEKLRIPSQYPSFKAVYSIEFTNNDSLLWIGTSGYGLIRINLTQKNGNYQVEQFSQYNSSDQDNSLNNDVVYAIASNKEGKLWFGTRGGGIYQIGIQTNTIQSLEEINSKDLLTNNDVLCLLCDQDNLWIGTSYGLNKLENTNGNYQLSQYADYKLNNKTIHGILQDEVGNFWLSTNQGLSHIDLKDNKTYNFTFIDGLQNDEFADGAFYKDSHNILYFGGVGGLNYFSPRNIHFREFSPVLALNSLKIYNKEQDISQKIKNGVLQLNYEERFVSLTFIAKDFINNENCEYAYRFTNQSDAWFTQANNPNIIFSQLLPGVYNLEVKCTNGNKIWSDNLYKLTIKVGYPWWLRTPAILSYITIIIIIVLITRSVIKNHLQMSKQILIAQTEKRQEQKTYESRLNFFTNVAHEFFTPLTLIYTPAQHLLEQKDLNDETKKYLQIIKNNAERMQKLISELMEFRKSKLENMKIHPSDIDIKALIYSATENYIDILKNNKIDFHVDIAENVSIIHSDQSALEKIIFNLLSNAFKYTPQKGSILVKATQEETNKMLCLNIRNSGKGLTEQQMKEIFNKYKIFDTPTKQSHSVSNGIGLNLTKRLVELLGGNININSELGKFVEFSVTIPTLEKEESVIVDPEEKKNLPISKEPEKEEEANKNKCILIVEDEKSIRDLLRDVLSDYTIIEAKDGTEALSEIEITHPDIIVSDIVMPNMDGLCLINKLKSNPLTSYIPIIGISANTSVEDQIEAFNHGADAYITKPFHTRQIISAIENLLTRQSLLKDYFNSSMSSIKIKDGLELHPEDEQLIQKVTDFITENIDDESLNPSSIADFVGVSKATLYRKFKEILNKTPSEFIRSIRLDHACKLLRTTRLTVLEIMYKSGFTNKSYFYREFQKQYGMSPTDYRNQ